MRLGPASVAILLGGPLLFMIVFFVLPFASVTASSVHDPDGGWSLANFSRIIGDPYYWGVIYLSFKITLFVTLIALCIGYPLAYTITFLIQSALVRRLAYILIVIPLFTSSIVRSFGWLVLLGRRGMVNNSLTALGIVDSPLPLLFNSTAVIIGMTYIMLPFMVLLLASVLQNIDKSLLEAANDLGANPIVSFFTVTFPLSLPGVIAGSLIVFTLSISAYVTPSILSGGRITVMSMLVYQEYASKMNYNFGASLAIILLAVTLLFIIVYLMIVERYVKAGAG